MALFGPFAMSDLSPLCAQEQTSLCTQHGGYTDLGAAVAAQMYAVCDRLQAQTARAALVK
jgi:hypothetical protein